MGLARVWNDHTKPYSEKYEDTLITIAPKGYVDMDRSDAIKFMGQYVPLNRLDSGEVLNPKMLRMEVIPDAKPEVIKIACQMCKEEFQTDKELALHSELTHAGDMIDEDARKAAAKRK